MHCKEGVVDTLHAGSFMKRTLQEFITEVCLIEFKGFLCGNPTEKKTNYISSRQTVCKSNPGTLIICRNKNTKHQYLQRQL